MDNATFLAGKLYTFAITITTAAHSDISNPIFNGEISFDSTVEDWDEESGIEINQP